MLHRKKKPTQKYPIHKHIRNLLIFTVFSFIGVVNYQIFIASNHMLPGGVWGFAAILNHFIPVIPMGIYVALLNLPLMIWGWRHLDTRFAIYTLYAILLQAVFLTLVENNVPTYTNNILLACIFGGVLSGLGGGMIVRYHGSGGGTDIVGIILKSKYDISVGTISFGVNACVVLVAGVIFGFEPAMYTMVYLYIATAVFNEVLEGLNRKRNMMIVTEKGHELAARLISELGRGVTILPGEGGYTHKKKEVLFCVVSRFELSALKEIIQEVDPDAFVCINRTYEVMGQFRDKAEIEKRMKENAKKAELAAANKAVEPPAQGMDQQP